MQPAPDVAQIRWRTSTGVPQNTIHYILGEKCFPYLYDKMRLLIICTDITVSSSENHHSDQSVLTDNSLFIFI